VDLQTKTPRELNNLLSDLRVKIVNIESDLKRLERHRSEHEMKVRRLKKEIQRKKIELDNLNLSTKKFDKDEFELNNNRRLLKKQMQELMAQIRNAKE